MEIEKLHWKAAEEKAAAEKVFSVFSLLFFAFPDEHSTILSVGAAGRENVSFFNCVV